MEFFRQEYWNGLPFFSTRESSRPRDLTSVSCVSCFASRFFTWWTTGEALIKQRPTHSHGRMGNSLAVLLKLSLYQTFFFFGMCYFLIRIHTHTHTQRMKSFSAHNKSDTSACDVTQKTRKKKIPKCCQNQNPVWSPPAHSQVWPLKTHENVPRTFIRS